MTVPDRCASLAAATVQVLLLESNLALQIVHAKLERTRLAPEIAPMKIFRSTLDPASEQAKLVRSRLDRAMAHLQSQQIHRCHVPSSTARLLRYPCSVDFFLATRRIHRHDSDLSERNRPKRPKSSDFPPLPPDHRACPARLQPHPSAPPPLPPWIIILGLTARRASRCVAV
jgi:hypothetical protein